MALALVGGLSLLLWVAADPVKALPPSGLTTTSIFTLEGTAKTQVDDLTAQAQAIQADIDGLDELLDLKAREYDKCLGGLDGASARMSELRRRVADAQADKERRQALLAQRIKSVYMSGGRDLLLQLLLVADGLEDLYNRVRLVSTLVDQDRRLVSDLEASSQRLDLLVQAFDEQKRQELEVRRQLTDRAAEIQAILVKRQETLAGVDARVRAIVEQERQRQTAERERLQRELEAKMAAAAAAAATGKSPNGSNNLRPEQIALVAQKAGFKGDNLVIAVAVALAESGGNANAKGDVTIGGSFGLWQIFCVAHPYMIPPDDPNSVAWYDPYQSAQWAYKLSGGGSWLPWSTYIHGSYLSRMAAAQEGVRILATDPLSVTPPRRSPTTGGT
jgi:peptidoglycan hydrolase CwlO-like protein